MYTVHAKCVTCVTRITVDNMQYIRRPKHYRMHITYADELSHDMTTISKFKPDFAKKFQITEIMKHNRV